MSSLELNKIAGAVLTAGVIAMSAGFIADLLVNPRMLEENVFVVAGGEEAGEAADEAEDEGPQSILPLLASADPAAGEKVAKKCTACHSFDEGGADKIGPNLWNVVNREIASVGGFGYSDALQGMAGEVWDYEALGAFLADPKGWAPGTKMSFAGLKKPEDQASMVAYLRSLSGDPAPLPSEDEIAAATGGGEAEAEPAEAEAAETEAAGSGESEATETEATEAEPMETGADAAESTAMETQQAATDGGEGGLGPMIAAATPEAGKKVFKKCGACHTFEQGGANKLGPNLYNVPGRQVAAADGYKYSKGLSEKAGESWMTLSIWIRLERPLA